MKRRQWWVIVPSIFGSRWVSP